MKLKSLLLLSVVLSGGVASQASAEIQYFSSYSITNALPVPITNIVVFEERAGSYTSATWAFQLNALGTTQINNPFPSPAPVTKSFMMGLATGLPGDGNPNQEHLVLMVDDFAKSLMTGIAWGTIFPTILEENLIDDLKLATSGQDWEIIQPGLDSIWNFSQNEARSILGAGGFTYDSWFDMPTNSFSVIAFSEGIEAGSGEGFVEAVPEPGTIAALGLGIAALARRRKS